MHKDLSMCHIIHVMALGVAVSGCLQPSVQLLTRHHKKVHWAWKPQISGLCDYGLFAACVNLWSICLTKLSIYTRWLCFSSFPSYCTGASRPPRVFVGVARFDETLLKNFSYAPHLKQASVFTVKCWAVLLYNKVIWSRQMVVCISDSRSGLCFKGIVTLLPNTLYSELWMSLPALRGFTFATYLFVATVEVCFYSD